MNEEQLTNIYNAFTNGKMSEADKQEYLADVKSGIVNLPKGISLPNTAMELPKGVFDAYFNGTMDAQSKVELEADIKNGLVKLPENIQASLPTVPMSPERPQDTGVALQKDYTPTEQIQAGLQTAGTLATGATMGAIGNIVGATSGIIDSMIQGTFGTQAGAKEAQKTSEEFAQVGTYQPDNKLAQEYTQNVAKLLEPTTAIAPMDLGIIQSAKVAREMPVGKAGDIYQGKQQTIQEAGITPMTSDIAPPTTAIGKVAQSISEKVPFTGTGAKRVEQQGQRISAIKDLADELGYKTEDVTSNITQDLLSKRSETISKYSNMKKDIFNKIDEKSAAPVDTTKTINTIDEQIANIKGLGLAENDKAITTLEDFKQAFPGKNLNQVEDLRKALGNKLNDEGLTSVKDILEKSSKKVYDSLKSDIGSHIGQFGEKNDLTKWNVANKRLSDSINELEVSSLKNVLNKGSATPEKINSMLFSKNQSDQKLLFNNLSQEGKANARISIINKIINDSGSENLSTAKFISNLKKNDISINTFFKNKDIQKIKGLNKALELTRQAETAGLNPPTGVQALMPVVFSGLGSTLGTVGGATAGLGIGLLGRVYESQPVSNLLIKLGKAPKAQETQLFKLLNDNLEKGLQIENLNLQQGQNDGK